MNKVLIKECVYRAGFVLRTERHPDFENTEMVSAYTPNGDYIGDPKTARMLAKRGIVPQLRTRNSNVCSIGYCARERKWYGWSHRGMFGFRIGSIVRKGSVIAGSLPISFRAKTLADAKRMAEAYAEGVS